MGDKPEEQKYDTLSLLAGLSDQNTGGYSVDDILNEFGRDEPKTPAPPAPPAPQQEPEPKREDIVDQIQQAIDREMDLNMAAPEPVIQLEHPEEPPAAPDVPPQEPPKPPKQDFGDEELNRLLEENNIRLKHQDDPPAPKRRKKAEDDDDLPDDDDAEPVTRREARRLKVLSEPVPDAAATYKKYARAIRPSRTRTTLVLILTLAAILWTAANQFGWSGASVFASGRLASKFLLGLMALCALLSFSVLKNGLNGIFHLRFNLDSLVVLIFAVAAVAAVRCGDDSPLPFCAVVCVEFLFASWGDTLKNVGIRRALKPVQKLEGEPEAILRVDGAWDGGLLLRGQGSVEEHVRGVLSPNLTEKRMQVYAPVAALLTLGLAFFVRMKTGNSLTWAWSSMMAGALPMAGFISYYRAFAILSGRLLKQGAAIGGWLGAKRLGTGRGALLRDNDIFPAENVTLNGMKVYGSYSVGQSIGYAAAVIEASGSGLTPLFQELRENNNGRRFAVSQFRRYEGGGYGAEIGGDVVLLGSLRFMQLMGVYMHEGTRVRNAVYLSVNGEMCGVFALNYAASGKVRKGLRQIIDSRGLMPVFATRDFLITPVMVEERYKVPNGALTFPSAEDRSRLSQLPGDLEREQGAVLAHGGFGGFADAVAGARHLRFVVSFSTTINIIGGLVGLALMFFLTYLGAQTAVTAMRMLAFCVIWALPSLVLTSWAGRY